ncbi:hypothetical protein JCM8547_002494 [Rhodosporidiobolus lusitaniae]
MSAVLPPALPVEVPAPPVPSTAPPTLPAPSSDTPSLPLPRASTSQPSQPRPPLVRANTSIASGASNGAGGGAGGACRLLWRGALVTTEGRKLHGIAIIAHLFTLSSSSSSSSTKPGLPSPSVVHATPSSLSPFDDPFASASSAATSGADMCLGLEMLRGADVEVKGEVGVRRKGEDNPSSAVAGNGKGKKGKGKEKEESEQVEVETPTDVRVYLDQRCPDTVEWFEDMFCREGREGVGIRIDAGCEEVVLFASLPSPPSDPPEQENVDPSTSSAAPPGLPLTLLLGRPCKAAVRKPRPDDPMPRENLFTKKLRKTASLPASSFSLTSSNISSSALKPPKPKRQTAKDKAIASLLSTSNPNGTSTSSRPKPRTASSLPPSMAFHPPPLSAGNSRSLSRTASSSRLFSTSTSSSRSRDSSLPPPPLLAHSTSLLSSRRSSLVADSSSGAATAARSFQRSRSRSQMILDSPPSSDVEEDDRLRHRAPSPTPSLASVFGAPDGEREEDEEMREESQDAVADLRSIAGGGGGRRGGMGRSSSLPVGQFKLSSTSAEGVGRKRKREEREGSIAPAVKASTGGGRGDRARSESVGPGAGGGENTIEGRNKNAVKKMVLNQLVALGVGKDHPEFHDVFQFTRRGVAFAMRSTFTSTLLTLSSRQTVEALIQQHLMMYLPPLLLISSTSSASIVSLLPTPTPEPTLPPSHPSVSTGAALPVKLEPIDKAPPSASLTVAVGSEEKARRPAAPPSPKSLGVEVTVEVKEGEEEDVETAETQVHEDEGEDVVLLAG